MGGPTAIRPEPAHKLSEAEKEEILEVVNQPAYASLPPTQVVLRLADQGVRSLRFTGSWLCCPAESPARSCPSDFILWYNHGQSGDCEEAVVCALGPRCVLKLGNDENEHEKAAKPE